MNKDCNNCKHEKYKRYATGGRMPSTCKKCKDLNEWEPIKSCTTCENKYQKEIDPELGKCSGCSNFKYWRLNENI